MNNWEYPGARWWKFDFHTHTPASTDFTGREELSPETWLRKFMEKGIDCVAITDHNSGEWIDILKQKLKELKKEQPAWYRPIYLFPGVEISVNGGVHMLAIFGTDKSTADVNSLLGAVGYLGERGESKDVTEKSLIEVVNLISTKFDAIPIPAHVDKKNGLFEEVSRSTLNDILQNPNIRAMELRDEQYEKPELYKSRKTGWTEVIGSDWHNSENRNLGDFTWVKMDDPPSIGGLKLALIDGATSVSRNMDVNPNRHAEFVIEKLSIEKARYIGEPDPLICRFSPFLNTIIGGRGSGKSTLLEFMRLALRREEEIPQSLKAESRKYFDTTEEENLLTDESIISLIYRKGDTRYRLNWSANADIFFLEEMDKNGEWIAGEGEIQSLFPARIYSQKQIFELAKNPQGLLGIIDEAQKVECEKFRIKQEELKNRYKQNTREVKELLGKISQREKLQGELKDLERQIMQIMEIEKAGHKDVLQSYRRRNQQKNEIKALEDGWKEMVEWLENNQEEITSFEIKEEIFSEHKDILAALNKTNNEWQSLNEEFIFLTQKAQSILKRWEEEKKNADWMKAIEVEMSEYETLRAELKELGIDPEKYPLLLAQQKIIKKQLDNIDEYNIQKDKLMAKREELYEHVKENRKMLTENRKNLLESILQEDKSVHIKVIPFGENWDDIEKNIRNILQCHDRFYKDMENLASKYSGGSKDIQILKDTIRKIRHEEIEAKDRRFAAHLQSLPQESIDDLMLWFPDDGLYITFGADNKKIQSGSPGQKNAALLAFILSYGDEPLLLDQPEDDLDNQLIYNLIVEQLKKIKSKRQIIVITHNANIVVNGDAEMVVPMIVNNGKSYIEHPASIQNSLTRKAICNILEGGQKAFEQRYRRIHLEHENA